ncbi:MAG: tryptophan--tRNA ligase [Coxiellaceae bacterium]|nr:tryptophan--tRNA ligase [Coxiellaceae bacterium]|tara:strand:- start:1737 stop:2729 length:993 start_codon:yes stop_codon:yes gene_type:complete
MSHRVLTGITPSGIPHLGNYIGCIRPALASQNDGHEHLYFIADLHSLIKQWDAKSRQNDILHVAATWLALGLDPKKTIFYRQSDIPEILELNWILTSIAGKGLLNRAHAYKDKVTDNIENKQDADKAITMGLFCYPILMAADILAFNADSIPVGKDQLQHVEIARDIAARFNHVYQQDFFTLPKAMIDEKTQTILGRDGRKMSKSYDNTIPIFLDSKPLRKHIMKIVTNSLMPGEPKSTEGCTLFSIYSAIATPEETEAFRQAYAEGISWGDAKQIVFEYLDQLLEAPRVRYQDLITHPNTVFAHLVEGAHKAQKITAPILAEVRGLVGL